MARRRGAPCWEQAARSVCPSRCQVCSKPGSPRPSLPADLQFTCRRERCGALLAGSAAGGADWRAPRQKEALAAPLLSLYPAPSPASRGTHSTARGTSATQGVPLASAARGGSREPPNKWHRKLAPWLRPPSTVFIFFCFAAPTALHGFGGFFFAWGGKIARAGPAQLTDHKQDPVTGACRPHLGKVEAKGARPVIMGRLFQACGAGWKKVGDGSGQG